MPIIRMSGVNNAFREHRLLINGELYIGYVF